MAIHRNITPSVIAAALLLQSVSVPAQTQSQQDRLDLLARFTGAMPFCQRLGFDVADDTGERLGAVVEAEVVQWEGDKSAIAKMVGDTVRRQTAIAKSDLEHAASTMNSDEELRSVRSIFLKYGRLCIAAAHDKSFAQIVAIPPGFDLEGAATTESDKLLEGGGLASWQTPEIQVRGDLMMLAGTCRRQIGAVRSDALIERYGRSDDPRARGYYLRQFDEGLADTELNFDKTQCDRAIGRFEAKLPK